MGLCICMCICGVHGAERDLCTFCLVYSENALPFAMKLMSRGHATASIDSYHVTFQHAYVLSYGCIHVALQHRCALLHEFVLPMQLLL